jgi:SSS family solute:Na+ symporter
MNYFSSAAFIVYAFLLIILLVGLWASKNIKTIEDYAIGNKTYGTGVLTMTFLATYLGAWNLIGFPGDVYGDGLTHIIPEVIFGVFICLLFIAKFIAPRMVNFIGCLTMGDLMGRFYGEYGRILTGFLGLVYNITAVSIQILFLSYISNLLGINKNWGVGIGALVIVIYASLGGIRAVTITDIIQFTLTVVAVSIMLNIVIDKVGGVKQLFLSLPESKLHFFKSSQDKREGFSAGYYSFPILAIWFLFPGYPLSFPFIQRMLMAKNKQQLVSMYYVSMGFLAMVFLSLTLIGLGMFILYPHIAPGQVVLHLIKELPLDWLKGVGLVGILAVIMSTSDSFLHAAGLLLTHDIIKPLFDKKNLSIDELKTVKYATFLIGCMSIGLALLVKDIFKIAIYGMDLGALLFTVPLIAGIMGLKTHPKTFFIASAFTLMSFFITQLYLSSDLSIPICIVANLISFFGTHAILKKA